MSPMHTAAKMQQCAGPGELMDHFAYDAALFFRDIIAPVSEVLQVDDALQGLDYTFQRMNIDHSPALTKTVQQILTAESPIKMMEGIACWARENTEAHALKVFEIYDNLFCIMMTRQNNRPLPPSLRFIIGTAEAGWEAAFLSNPQSQQIVERYLYFLDIFWLPLVENNDEIKHSILRLLEVRRRVDYNTTTSVAVLSMKHALGCFEDVSQHDMII